MEIEDFLTWMQVMGYDANDAADALGIHRVTIGNYCRGTRHGGRAGIPLVTALACSALRYGLEPYSRDIEETTEYASTEDII